MPSGKAAAASRIAAAAALKRIFPTIGVAPSEIEAHAARELATDDVEQLPWCRIFVVAGDRRHRVERIEDRAEQSDAAVIGAAIQGHLTAKVDIEAALDSDRVADRHIRLVRIDIASHAATADVAASGAEPETVVAEV